MNGEEVNIKSLESTWDASIKKLEEKIHSLKNEIFKKDLLLRVERIRREEAEVVVGFYADTLNWRDPSNGYDSGYLDQIDGDSGLIHGGNYCGGKRAREYFVMQEKKNEL